MSHMLQINDWRTKIAHTELLKRHFLIESDALRMCWRKTNVPNPQNAPIPYPTTLYSEQTRAHFYSEWSIVRYGSVYSGMCELGQFWTNEPVQPPPWWCHQMDTSSALVAICVGNSQVTGEFSAQRPVTRSFDVFRDLHLNERLSKQLWDWWFDTSSRPLWHHSDVRYGPVKESRRI